MLLEDIEAIIAARLTLKIPALPVMALPEFEKLEHKIGAILIRYAGGKYGEPISTDIVVQERHTRWEIIIVMRALRGSQGVHAALDAVRQALTGWQPYGATKKTILINEDFDGEQSGIWQYTLTIEIPVMNIETVELETGPKLTKLITDYGDYGTEDILVDDLPQ